MQQARKRLYAVVDSNPPAWLLQKHLYNNTHPHWLNDPHTDSLRYAQDFIYRDAIVFYASISPSNHAFLIDCYQNISLLIFPVKSQKLHINQTVT